MQFATEIKPIGCGKYVKLNLCIEFDGSYWHKDKRDIDKIKSEMLFEEGFKLIRLREEPLKKIYDF